MNAPTWVPAEDVVRRVEQALELRPHRYACFDGNPFTVGRNPARVAAAKPAATATTRRRRRAPAKAAEPPPPPCGRSLLTPSGDRTVCGEPAGHGHDPLALVRRRRGGGV